MLPMCNQVAIVLLAAVAVSTAASVYPAKSHDYDYKPSYPAYKDNYEYVIIVKWLLRIYSMLLICMVT